MSSDATIIEGAGAEPENDPNATIFEPRSAPPADPNATIIEGPVAADPNATIIESGATVGFRPFTDLSPGADFLEYRLMEVFAVASAEADIWLIERKTDGRKFVLKLYRYGIKPKEEIMRVVHELCRDHIVEVAGSGEKDGRSYEIQEFVSGGSLEDLIKQGAVNEAKARAIVRELADAIAHLHEANVLHRDIKPANILVRSTDPLDLVVTDFGISSVADLDLHMTNANRTAAYSAPEALTGVVAKASDWWSLGVMVVELLTGRHPLAGLNELAVNFQLVSKGIGIPENLPEAWVPLAKGLLTRDHEKRWNENQIQAWLEGASDIAVYYEGAGSAEEAACKPYKFCGKETSDPKELAALLGENWSEAGKHIFRGFVGKWIESELGDYDLAIQLSDITGDFSMDTDQKLMVALMVLNPDMPPVYKGAVLDIVWCQNNLEEALKLAGSPAGARLKEQRNEAWLSDWKEHVEAVRAEASEFGVELNAEMTAQLVVAPVENVIETAMEQRAQYAGAREPKLNPLFEKAELTLADAIVLLACDRSLFLTRAEKAKQDKLARLDAFGVGLDWQLAERLIAVDDWAALQPLWEDARRHYRMRQKRVVGIQNERLRAILESEEPDYLDAVAVVANRLDFVNSLEMRFVPVPGVFGLLSVWPTRNREFEIFANAAGLHHKKPAWEQGPLHPVVNVRWDQAVQFCQALTESERHDGLIGPDDEYRLPSDIEWSAAIGLVDEVAGYPNQRSGKIRDLFSWGTAWPPPKGYGNFGMIHDGDEFSHTSPAGSFPANQFGIYDLDGNVMEWCSDWHSGARSLRTVRGSSWSHASPENYWMSMRRSFAPNTASEALGFRCVLSLKSWRPDAVPEATPAAPGTFSKKPGVIRMEFK